MPAYKVLITLVAEKDIEESVRYISRDNPAAAGNWRDKILEGVGYLEKFPGRAPRIPEHSGVRGDYRHLIFGNYRIVFRVEEKTVMIVRVIHSARLLDLGEEPPG